MQEPIDVAIRIGFDREFFKANVLQTSRQQMDVPVQVDAPWLRDLPGTTMLENAAGNPRRPLSFALNEERAVASQLVDRLGSRRLFTVMQIEKPLLATAPGTLVIPGPTLRYAYGTRFEDDLVNGRVPVDRHEAVVRGHDLTLTILPLPEDGRPAGFSGAVGQFTVRAGADRRDVAADESLKLTLTISGPGNLQSFEPPELDGIAGFHVQGMIDRKGSSQRAITYDLAPLNDDVKDIPPISFSFFDLTPPAQYRVVHTDAIPITVRPRPTSAPAKPAPANAGPLLVPGTNDIFGLKPSGMASAERAYTAGRYDDAIARFEASLEEPEASRAAILYDLGNCLFRQTRDAEALVAFRRARLLLPRDPEVRFNLELTERRLGVEEPATSSFGAVVLGAVDSFTDRELAILAAALLGSGIIGLTLLRHRPKGRFAMIVVMALGLAVAARPVRDHAFPGPRAAVVVATEIGLRDEPHGEVTARIRLRAGESVRVAEMSDRWVRVICSRGSGWTERGAIGIVD